MLKLPASLSMQNKLVLMFVGTTLVVYLALAFILYYTIERHFFNQDYSDIVTKYNAIEKTMLVSPESAYLIIDNSSAYMWAYKDKTLTYKNSTLSIPDGLSLTLSSPQILDRNNAIEWRENSLDIRAFAFKNKDAIVVIGMSINHHRLFLSKLGWILFWSLGFAFIASTLFSRVIVNRGLKPIVALNKHIQHITPEQLDIRIDPESLPVELHELAAKHNAMLDRLQMGFHRLSEFSSDIAHELKTPLTNITTQNQVILGACRTSEEYQEAIASTLEELNRITKTINDLLYIAKAENKLIHRHNEAFAVEEQIERLIEYFDIWAEDSDLTITTSGQAMLFMDRNMFDRAVGNVLSNAIRHAYDETVISIKVAQGEGQVSITVTNAGETIPRSYLPYLFERFYRVDKSRQNTGSVGAGLGLSITQSIVRAYDGQISVASENNQTQFCIMLPAIHADQAAELRSLETF
ncbi:heavy metal sensor histidine kinase [Vibrio coralliilyticus]|uniref:heavy metal sensor histidine kinase n=1 Tax=Vibrio coralliilyticus TaxID=190893 RepID=UPI0006CC9F2D|nr:heavy metal sensor histidine kinase [Vibrio coralliilyticus]AXN31595.1 HAMP domain-containing protein [Vibrio coralliilyticus]KPH27973.1 histidine kinase [Vibrio coralliilyticus]